MHNFGEHFTPVFVGDGIEFSECGEEVMADVAIVWRGDEIADGPGINHMVAQRKIGKRLRGGYFALRGIARRRRKGHDDAVNTQAVCHGVVDVAFGVHRAGKVMVQIAALGHARQKIHQRGGIVARGFQELRGAVGGRRRLRGHPQAAQNREQWRCDLIYEEHANS